MNGNRKTRGCDAFVAEGACGAPPQAGAGRKPAAGFVAPHPQSATLAALLAGTLAASAHDHLNAGALAPTAGSQLAFSNGGAFVTNSGYVLQLDVRPETGPAWYAGPLTLTSLPATPFTGGPLPGHAALGARIAARVEVVTGPAGGRFSLWQEPDEGIPAVLQFTVPAGETAGTNLFLISENDGEPDADPYGHIHGRFFAADRPGLYVLGLRLVDTSANGPEGGPLHTPGELFPLYLQAGYTIADARVVDGEIRLTFGTALGRRYTVEGAPEAVGPWTPDTTEVSGNNHLQTVSVPVSGTARFFRLRVE